MFWSGRFWSFLWCNSYYFPCQKTPLLHVINGVKLTFVFENSFKFHFFDKKYEKIKIFFFSYLYIQKIFYNWYSKYSLVKLLKWLVMEHSTLGWVSFGALEPSKLGRQFILWHRILQQNGCYLFIQFGTFSWKWWAPRLCRKC